MSHKKVIQAFCLSHSYSPKDNLFIKLLRKEGFDNNQIVKILHISEYVCPECYDNSRDCSCEREH